MRREDEQCEHECRECRTRKKEQLFEEKVNEKRRQAQKCERCGLPKEQYQENERKKEVKHQSLQHNSQAFPKNFQRAYKDKQRYDHKNKRYAPLKADITTTALIYYPIQENISKFQNTFQQNHLKKISQHPKVPINPINQINHPYIQNRRPVFIGNKSDNETALPQFIEKVNLPTYQINQPKFQETFARKRPEQQYQINSQTYDQVRANKSEPEVFRSDGYQMREKIHSRIPTFQNLQCVDDYEKKKVKIPRRRINCCNQCQAKIFNGLGQVIEKQVLLREDIEDDYLEHKSENRYYKAKKVKIPKNITRKRSPSSSFSSESDQNIKRNLYRTSDELKTERLSNFIEREKTRKNSEIFIPKERYQRERVSRINQPLPRSEERRNVDYYRNMINRQIYHHMKGSKGEEAKQFYERGNEQGQYIISKAYRRPPRPIQQYQRPRITSTRPFEDLIYVDCPYAKRRVQLDDLIPKEERGRETINRMKRAKSAQILLLEERISQLKAQNQRLRNN